MSSGRAIVLSLLAGGVTSVLAAHADAYAIWNAAGVWDVPANKRVTYDPTAAVPKIGNMSTGVKYKTAAAPAAAQAGAVASLEAGYAPWNLLGVIPGVRINFQPTAGVANVNDSWAAIAAPGRASIVDNKTMTLELNSTRTLRTDGWSLDFAGTRPDNIDEYDAYSVSVHEVGHVVGLNHPGAPANRIMNGSNLVRQAAAGQWRPFEKTRAQILAIDPALKTLAGAALPANTIGYQNPRNIISFVSDLDTVRGALTLYSAPKSWIRGLVAGASGPGSGSYFYSYEVENQSANGVISEPSLGDVAVASDYNVREFTVPVPDGISISNVTAPSGWSYTRDSSGLHFTAISASAGLEPGELATAGFESSMPPTFGAPSARWMLPNYEASATGQDDGDHDEMTDPPLAFNPMDFAPGNNPFAFADFNSESDSWELQNYSLVPVPVPTPGALTLIAAAGLTAIRRIRRSA